MKPSAYVEVGRADGEYAVFARDEDENTVKESGPMASVLDAVVLARQWAFEANTYFQFSDWNIETEWKIALKARVR